MRTQPNKKEMRGGSRARRGVRFIGECIGIDLASYQSLVASTFKADLRQSSLNSVIQSRPGLIKSAFDMLNKKYSEHLAANLSSHIDTDRNQLHTQIASMSMFTPKHRRRFDQESLRKVLKLRKLAMIARGLSEYLECHEIDWVNVDYVSLAEKLNVGLKPEKLKSYIERYFLPDSKGRSSIPSECEKAIERLKTYRFAQDEMVAENWIHMVDAVKETREREEVDDATIKATTRRLKISGLVNKNGLLGMLRKRRPSRNLSIRRNLKRTCLLANANEDSQGAEGQIGNMQHALIVDKYFEAVSVECKRSVESKAFYDLLCSLNPGKANILGHQILQNAQPTNISQMNEMALAEASGKT